VLQDEEKFAPVLAAVYVHVMQVHFVFVRFQRDVLTEPLAQSRFACSYVACHDYALRHLLRNL
jgi:hypothetical protein